MLIAFLSLIALINGCLTGIGLPTLQQILGYAFAPIAWLLGVAWNDCQTIGQFLGTRLVLNEFVAFIELGKYKAQLDPKSFVIATFALCGFANISSIGIQVGGIGAMAPERRKDLAKLGWRALLGGNLATFMCAAIVGILT